MVDLCDRDGSRRRLIGVWSVGGEAAEGVRGGGKVATTNDKDGGECEPELEEEAVKVVVEWTTPKAGTLARRSSGEAGTETRLETADECLLLQSFPHSGYSIAVFQRSEPAHFRANAQICGRDKTSSVQWCWKIGRTRAIRPII
jgi:hypothetical protein